MADRVGVLRAGTLEQVAPPEELYARPATQFVAEFVGLTNRLRARVAGGRATVESTSLPTLDGSVSDGVGTALIRPEAVHVSTAGGESVSNGTVVTSSFLGAISRITVELDDGTSVISQVPRTTAPGVSPGDRVAVTIDDTPVLVVAD